MCAVSSIVARLTAPCEHCLCMCRLVSEPRRHCCAQAPEQAGVERAGGQQPVGTARSTCWQEG